MQLFSYMPAVSSWNLYIYIQQICEIALSIQEQSGCTFLHNLIVPKAFFTGFSDSSVGKEYSCNAGDPSSIPGSGRSPGEGKVYPLQYSGLENSMDSIVPEVTKSQTQLINFHSHSLRAFFGVSELHERTPNNSFCLFQNL